VVLDVSCGPGIITTRIAAGLRGYDTLVASDVSEAMTKRAAEQLDTLAATDAGAPREGRKRRRRSKRREYGAFACFRGCARRRLRFAFRGRLGGGRAQQRGRALLARPYEGL
jgi:hypothetical protein